MATATTTSDGGELEAPDALAPGERLPLVVGDLTGKYRIDQILGMGRTSVVAAALRTDRSVHVALKVMRMPRATPATVEAFLAEGRAAMALKSEHVVRVQDVGVLPSGLPFFEMEKLEGHDLATLLERSGVIRPYLAIDYLVQACEAIGEAHRLGLIHHDLRLKNLFLTHREADGSPLIKVLDFGTAKITHDAIVRHAPMYMAPEQIKSGGGARGGGNADIDVRADVWALGAILFELVTGHRAFAADTVAEIIAKICDRPPPSLEVYLPNAPVGLSNVIQRCFEKDRKKRFSTAGALAVALSDLGSNAKPPSSSAVPAWDRSVDLNVGSLVALNADIASSPSSTGGSSLRRKPRAATTTYVLPGRGRNRLAISAISAPMILIGVIALLAIVLGIGLYRHRASATTTPSPPPAESVLTTASPPTPSAIESAAPPPIAAAASSSSPADPPPPPLPKTKKGRPRSKVPSSQRE